jgi:4-oxalocrotonate tautomerase
MLNGRTEEQKKKLSEALSQAVQNVLNIVDMHVSVTIEDYSAKEWQEVFKEEITNKEKFLYKKPEYDPKSLM